jgi:catechol 2,3-dioxygenase-like lactoylglutathione lyase family enzyme
VTSAEHPSVHRPPADGEPPFRIDHLDHLVLTVGDVERTAAFYHRVLGMKVETFGAGRTALRFGQQEINLHPHGRELEPKALRPTPGSADLCFVIHGTLAHVASHLRASGVPVGEGPVARTGAGGAMTSIYLRDPDGNLVELSTYSDADE